jgi:hypothetical protein
VIRRFYGVPILELKKHIVAALPLYFPGHFQLKWAIIQNLHIIFYLGSPFEGISLCVQGRSTYLGAAPIVHCLENYKPHVVITSRVADAALFLAPMVYMPFMAIFYVNIFIM